MSKHSRWLAICTLPLLFAFANRAMEVQAKSAWQVPPTYESAPRNTSFTITDEKGEKAQISTESHAILILEGKYEITAFSPVTQAAAAAELYCEEDLRRAGFMSWCGMTSNPGI